MSRLVLIFAVVNLKTQLMKRRIIIAFFALCAAAMAKAQVENARYWDVYDIGWWTTTDEESLSTDGEELRGRGFKGDGISVTYDISMSSSRNAFFMEIKNLTDSTITVKWPKSQIDGKRVVTGEESILSERDKAEEDDVVYPHDKIQRYVSSTYLVSNPYARPLDPYEYKMAFKKTKEPQQGKTVVTLCMERGGVEKIYRFTLHCVYNGKRK